MAKGVGGQKEAAEYRENEKAKDVLVFRSFLTAKLIPCGQTEESYTPGCRDRVFVSLNPRSIRQQRWRHRRSIIAFYLRSREDTTVTELSARTTFDESPT